MDTALSPLLAELVKLIIELIKEVIGKSSGRFAASPLDLNAEDPLAALDATAADDSVASLDAVSAPTRLTSVNDDSLDTSVGATDSRLHIDDGTDAAAPDVASVSAPPVRAPLRQPRFPGGPFPRIPQGLPPLVDPIDTGNGDPVRPPRCPGGPFPPNPQGLPPLVTGIRIDPANPVSTGAGNPVVPTPPPVVTTPVATPATTTPAVNTGTGTPVTTTPAATTTTPATTTPAVTTPAVTTPAVTTPAVSTVSTGSGNTYTLTGPGSISVGGATASTSISGDGYASTTITVGSGNTPNIGSLTSANYTAGAAADVAAQAKNITDKLPANVGASVNNLLTKIGY